MIKYDEFNSLSEYAKVVCLLSLCDLILDKITNSNGYDVVVEALDKSLEWLYSKKVNADQLYFYLENLDEKDIMSYMQLEKYADNEPVWLCIANALAYITRIVYQYEEEAYMPETIECVNDETVKSFFLNFHKICINNDISDKMFDILKGHDSLSFIQFNFNEIEQIYLDEQYVVIGNYCGNCICINKMNEVISIDLDGEYPVRFINANLKSFLKCISVFLEYEYEISVSDNEEIFKITEKIKEKINLADDRALATEENWWSIILEQIEFGG